MSISGVAFWSSDYAYEIMGAKRISSHQPIFPLNTSETAAEEQEFTGIKPRVDEYIPLFPRQNSDSSEISDLAGAQAVQFSGKTEQSELADEIDSDENKENANGGNGNGGEGQYSEEEQKIIDELKARDAEVRTHEQAHIAAGGAHILGGATYTTQAGPDGRHYAVGGEVSIDTSPVQGSPEETIAKMQVVRSAALAPASPSDADRAIAAAASQTEASARAELAEKTREQQAQASKADNENPRPQNTEHGGANNSESANYSAGLQNRIVSAISAYTSSLRSDPFTSVDVSA